VRTLLACARARLPAPHTQVAIEHSVDADFVCRMRNLAGHARARMRLVELLGPNVDDIERLDEAFASLAPGEVKCLRKLQETMRAIASGNPTGHYALNLSKHADWCGPAPQRLCPPLVPCFAFYQPAPPALEIVHRESTSCPPTRLPRPRAPAARGCA
jgi:hypothetical protein